MRRVKAENVEEGMVLARALHDEHGNILLRQGIELRAAHIKICSPPASKQKTR